ncbi:MAG: phosphoglycerate mutase [Peptococcaceae bacterium BICA1-7]|nr:MAG: phosphoglycerate mutase [Peptococcaceae bacterium BICA1-7]HBV96954.1 cofactor-independent phosphoglycerate mutase [Desulfotomaculum sp.]
MKYLVILGDGMADYRCADLGGKTPLQYAVKPNMDFMASRGSIGLVRTVAPGMPPGSDVANLSVMGYDPALYYTGRAPLEAVSMGVSLGENDVAFRCNLVTLSAERTYEKKSMVDYSSGEINSARAAELIKDLAAHLKSREMIFYPGISYRHLMVWSGGPADTVLTPPHDISGRVVGEYLPKGSGSEALLAVMKESSLFLQDHPLNRPAGDQRPANSVWFWGQGKTPSIPDFRDKYGLFGAVISAVDLIKGIGKCADMDVIEVEGATGNLHTNFSGKAVAAMDAFRMGADLVYLHIEAPDEAGHQGDTGAKVKAIEEIDRQVLGPLLTGMEEFGRFRVMLLPDHPTPLALMTHTSDPVPFAIYDSDRQADNSGKTYCEEDAAGGTFIEQGHELMEFFTKGY